MTRHAMFENRALRTFHAELAHTIDAEYRGRCPCCSSPMVRPRKANATSYRRRDKVTVAHDAAVSLGGDPTVWVYACQGCNSDQGMMTFRGWSHLLRCRGDARAEAVALLADKIEAYIKRK